VGASPTRFRDSDAFGELFESVVERCIAEGLGAGEGFAIDASIIRADANRGGGVPSTQSIEWPTPEQRSRAVREYMAALDAAGLRGDEDDDRARRGAPRHQAAATHRRYRLWHRSDARVALQDKEIEPHVPVWEKTDRDDGTFSARDFAWGEEANE
jgi:hypothetical protein